VSTKKLIIFNQFFRSYLGLSGTIADNSWIGYYSNSYAIRIVGHRSYRYRLVGMLHQFELPVGAIRPEMKDNGNVYGCGLVLDPDNKLAIFFTLNGKLLSKWMLEILRIKKKKIYI
jgi:hypothetical protein